MTKINLLILLMAIALSACGGDSNNSGDEVGFASTCAVDISTGATDGITAVPGIASTAHRSSYCKYTELVAPNGGVIAFYAQNNISNEQMLRARGILDFFLTDVPGSDFGSDKSAVFNQMATNGASLIMLNGSDDDAEPTTDGQTLYESENVVEGSAAYLINEPRDAAFEEILHLMHDTGIGVDGPNTQPGVVALAPYQSEIRTAMENAIAPGIINSSSTQLGLWGSIAPDWLQELSGENSLTQEYLASVVDTYYGLAGQSSNGGSNDLYTPQTRAEIETVDPMGWALVGGSSRKYFSEYVTYDARIDSLYEGTFTLEFDAATQYTHKSQYLLNASLTGGNSSNLVGNAQNNRLNGNEGDNEITGGAGNDAIDGGAGSDTAIFSGIMSDYTIDTIDGVSTVTDSVANRDGADTILNVELLMFSDEGFSP